MFSYFFLLLKTDFLAKRAWVSGPFEYATGSKNMKNQRYIYFRAPVTSLAADI